jgi:hypothetical protein
MEKQLDTANKEQEAMIELFAEERNYRDQEEGNLKKKLSVSLWICASHCFILTICSSSLCCKLNVAVQIF